MELAGQEKVTLYRYINREYRIHRAKAHQLTYRMKNIGTPVGTVEDIALRNAPPNRYDINTTRDICSEEQERLLNDGDGSQVIFWHNEL